MLRLAVIALLAVAASAAGASAARDSDERTLTVKGLWLTQKGLRAATSVGRGVELTYEIQLCHDVQETVQRKKHGGLLGFAKNNVEAAYNDLSRGVGTLQTVTKCVPQTGYVSSHKYKASKTEEPAGFFRLVATGSVAHSYIKLPAFDSKWVNPHAIIVLRDIGWSTDDVGFAKIALPVATGLYDENTVISSNFMTADGTAAGMIQFTS
jgi:hypothetical protein